MTSMQVDCKRVKTIRKARKIGRPKLAKLIGLTERQVAKLELRETQALPDTTVERLSVALQVPVLTLTGEFPVIETDLQPASTCTKGCCS